MFIEAFVSFEDRDFIAQSTPTPTTFPDTLTPTPNPTVNWEKYSNVEHGFLFKIPKSFTQESYNEGDFQGRTFFSPEVPRLGTELIEGLMVRTLIITDTPQSLRDYAQEYFDKDLNSPPNSEIENGVSSTGVEIIALDGRTAYKYQIEGYGNVIVVFIQLDNGVLRLTGHYQGTPEEKEKFINTFNQILSTFEFNK